MAFLLLDRDNDRKAGPPREARPLLKESQKALHEAEQGMRRLQEQTQALETEALYILDTGKAEVLEQVESAFAFPMVMLSYILRRHSLNSALLNPHVHNLGRIVRQRKIAKRL